jgi:two-component system, OmpR family, KDP operon response regulator KdpE
VPDKKTVLIIEDEIAIVRFLRTSLQDNGFLVLEASNGKTALDVSAAKKPDVILLDLGLPDLDGLEVLKGLRRWTSVPVIILSARGQEGDKIAALDSGADDYLTKPFGVAELMARLRVALRHAEKAGRPENPVYEHAGLKVDLAAHRVWHKKKEIHLSPLQYELLAVLASNAGRVISQKHLIREVWRESFGEATPESVRFVVHQLRHKIEADPVRPKHLKTEPGIGYRLESD